MHYQLMQSNQYAILMFLVKFLKDVIRYNTNTIGFIVSYECASQFFDRTGFFGGSKYCNSKVSGNAMISDGFLDFSKFIFNDDDNINVMEGNLLRETTSALIKNFYISISYIYNMIIILKTLGCILILM